MPLRTPVALSLVAALLCSPSITVAQGAAPWVGTWRLNPARSQQRTAPSPYRRVTLRIEPSSDGVTVVYDMVGVRGGVTHVEWTGRFDGRDYAVQGVDYVLTNAYRPIDDRSYEITVKVDGTPAAIAVARVSPDGRTLTVTTTETDGKGVTVTTTAVYERLGV